MNVSDSLPLVLAARGALYRQLQALFGNEPTPDIIAAIACDEFCKVADMFSMLIGTATEKMQQRLEALRAARGLFEPKSACAVDSLRTAYCELFVGPGRPSAPPWESMHRGSNRALFQASTLDVRKAYVKQGLVPCRYPNVADDHIALELDFMGHLAQRMIESSNAGEQDAFEEAVGASVRFLDEHLLVWIPAWCASFDSASNACLYREAARMLETFIQQDREALELVSIEAVRGRRTATAAGSAL